MGAWTSTFTIGITLVSFNRLTLYRPFLQLKGIGFPNQPTLWRRRELNPGLAK